MKRSRLILGFRRRKEGHTDYRKRLKILLAKKTRLVIRKSLKNITLQMSEYAEKGDKTIVLAKASELRKYGWNVNAGNIPAAYLTGLLLAEKAKKLKLNECIVDIGFNKSVRGTRIYAAIKGVIDGGLKVPLSDENVPSETRISGKHIVDYALKLKENKQLYEKTFSSYLKNNAAPEQIQEMFKRVKGSLQAR
jgi:large subunit ribosomal protein L18